MGLRSNPSEWRGMENISSAVIIHCRCVVPESEQLNYHPMASVVVALDVNGYPVAMTSSRSASSIRQTWSFRSITVVSGSRQAISLFIKSALTLDPQNC
ncbi:hypothetical protein NPIL_576301 [Nephila pilipes]|uniref:Uncharacterized protein n=1 Tax=Nephila pilipes TaxID=299642 RepID=A0A8X6NEG2_NEPPI|nr:hypothetical protein NPIL_576301 [Nephila pilipes]